MGPPLIKATIRFAAHFDPALSLRIELIEINAKSPQPNHPNSANDPEVN
jgi:hypothetical protein